MARMNGGQALIQALDQTGGRLVLGIPGAGQYEAVDPLYEHPRLRYISVRHEQAASYMADGYARVKGDAEPPATVLVVPGPGLYNAGAGIATAYACSTPMLVVTGVDPLHGRQIVPGEVAPALRSLTKWVGRATAVADIPDLVRDALYHAMSGRPRPVGLEIPASVLAAVDDVPDVEPPMIGLMVHQPEAMAQAAAQMSQARAPLIWAGSGVHRAGAWDALKQLAERWHAPVVTSRSGKGAIDDRHPLALGWAELRYPPLRRYLESRDVILAIGASVKLDKFAAKVIRIDADPAVVAGAAVPIRGDADAALRALLEVTLESMSPPGDAVHEVARLNRERFDPTRQLQPQWDLMQAMRRVLPEDAIVVQGMNQMGYYSRNYWPTYGRRAFLTSSSLATLGAEWPLALGAKLAAPDRAVVAICGDGGFMYNVQELATAVQYDIPAIAVVFNDHAYGNVLRAQTEQFDGRVIGTRLHNPDFVALAQSFGVWAVRADGAAALAEALTSALAARRPALIEVPVGPMQREY